MVKDHLTGGKYDLELTDDIVKETASVQKTNTISERDFAQLDRLLREKTKCNYHVIRGNDHVLK